MPRVSCMLCSGALAAFFLACPARAAHPGKVIRVAYPSAEHGFDCAAESDEFTGTLCDNIFDALLQYDHLARPIKLQPRAALALPDITDNGATYTFRIKPGSYFTADPEFNGKQRELTAYDYVYSLKRLIDPVVKAQWSFLMDGKLKGAEPIVTEAAKTNKFDYDQPMEGLQALDRYTLRIDRKSTRLNSSHIQKSRMPSSA